MDPGEETLHNLNLLAIASLTYQATPPEALHASACLKFLEEEKHV